MALLNSENIKTFKEDISQTPIETIRDFKSDISTLEGKASLSVEDCNLVDERLSTLTYALENSELDPVTFGEHVQMLKRYSNSLSFIRQKMIDAGAEWLFTNDMKKLIADIGKTLINVEVLFDSNKGKKKEKAPDASRILGQKPFKDIYDETTRRTGNNPEVAKALRNFVTLPIEEQIKLISTESADLNTHTSENPEVRIAREAREHFDKMELDFKMNQFILFLYVLHGKREELKRASWNPDTDKGQEAHKHVLEQAKYMMLSDREQTLLRQDRARIDDFLDPSLYNPEDPNNPYGKLSNSDRVIKFLINNPYASLEDALKETGFGDLSKYMKESKVDFKKLNGSKDLAKSKLAIAQYLYDINSYDLARQICYDIVRDDLNAYADKKGLLTPDGAVKLDNTISHFRPSELMIGSEGWTSVRTGHWEQAMIRVERMGFNTKYRETVAQQIFKEVTAMGGGTKADGTPFTIDDAKGMASQMHNQLMYSEYEKIRQAKILEDFYKDGGATISSEKKPFLEFLYKIEGVGTFGASPEVRDFGIDFAYEIGKTAVSMAISAGALKVVGGIAKAASQTAAVARMASRFPTAARFMAGAGGKFLGAAGSRILEAGVFESVYAGLSGEHLTERDNWFYDVLWSAATFEALGRVNKLGGKLTANTTKLGKLTARFPKGFQNVVNNWIITGNMEALTLMVIGAVRGGVIAADFSSWEAFVRSMKVYGIEYTENFQLEFFKTYATIIGLKGAAKITSPGTNGETGTPEVAPVKSRTAQKNANRSKAGARQGPNSSRAIPRSRKPVEKPEVAEKLARPSDSVIKKAPTFEALFELFPGYKTLKEFLGKSGLNSQWLEASLMDIKDPKQKYRAIEKISKIVAEETANGKKPDPTDLLNRLKEAKDPATATALEMLFKQFGSKLRFEPAEVEGLFGNDNTAFIAGDIMMRGMDTPAFATRMVNHIKSLIPAAEAKLKPFFEKAKRGEELTREEVLAADKALNENAVVRMISYLQTSAEKFGKELMGLKASSTSYSVMGLIMSPALFVANHPVITVLGTLWGKALLKTQRDHIRAFPQAQLARDTHAINGTGRMTDVIAGKGPIEQRSPTYLRSRDSALLEGVKTDYITETGNAKFYTIWVTRMLGLGDIVKNAGNTFIHRLRPSFIKKGEGEHERRGWQKKADKISETSSKLKDAMTTYETDQYTAPKEVLTFLTDVVATNSSKITSNNAEIAKINTEIATKNALIYAGKDPSGKLAAEVTKLTAEVAKLSAEVTKLTADNPVIESARENLRNPDGSEKPIVTEIRDKAVEISRESKPLERAALYDQMVALYDRAIAEMGRGKTPAEQAMLREVIKAEAEKNLRRAEFALTEWTAALEDAKKSMFDTLPDPIKARAEEIFEYLAKTTIFYGWGVDYFSFKGPKAKNPPKFLKGIVDSINTMDPGLRKLLIPLVGKAVPATFTALVVLAKVLAVGGVVVVGGTAIGLYALSEETEAAGLKAIESDNFVEALAELNQNGDIDLNDSLRDYDSFISLMNSGDVDESNPIMANFRKMTRFGGISWVRGGRKEFYERLKAQCLDSGICTERPSSRKSKDKTSGSKESSRKTNSEKSNILSRTLNGFTLPNNAPQGLVERLKKLRTTEDQADLIQDALTIYSDLKSTGDRRAIKLESRLMKISNDPDKKNFKSLEKALNEIR